MAGTKKTEKIEIGIIGGTGGMGAWFARWFGQQGFTVHVAGRRSGPSLPEMARKCRVVFVAVPIRATETVIREIGPMLDSRSLLCDLTSLKVGPVRAMLESAAAPEVVGCHPLFGPAAASLEGQNVILCPARGKKWPTWLRRVLKKGGARVTETTPERHDEIMAIVQGLTHLQSITMSKIIAESGLSAAELKRFSTPVFRSRKEMCEKISRHPGLYFEMLAGNPSSRDLFKKYKTHVAQTVQVLADHSFPE